MRFGLMFACLAATTTATLPVYGQTTGTASGFDSGFMMGAIMLRNRRAAEEVEQQRRQAHELRQQNELIRQQIELQKQLLELQQQQVRAQAPQPAGQVSAADMARAEQIVRDILNGGDGKAVAAMSSEDLTIQRVLDRHKREEAEKAAEQRRGAVNRPKPMGTRVKASVK